MISQDKIEAIRNLLAKGIGPEQLEKLGHSLLDLAAQMRGMQGMKDQGGIGDRCTITVRNPNGNVIQSGGTQL